MIRKIVHLDLDAFFCAVEEQRDPSLTGRAFAVGGRPESRGVVASCSYAARRFGVRSAMPMSRALRMCPGLLVVRPDFHAYSAASHEVMARLCRFSPLVEQISIDEAFLDLSDLPEPVDELARQVQRSIRDELGLPCSVGAATNKLVAKVASDVGKSTHRGDGPPNAVLVVPSGHEASFLAPLPAQALWGVGPKTASRLAELGIQTIGEIAARSEEYLAARFGKLGAELAVRARGIDDRPVFTEHELKSVSQEETFARDVADRLALIRTLRHQSERVGRRLRRLGLAGRTVSIKVRWPDFSTVSRQTTLPQVTNDDAEINCAAIRLFEALWQRGRAVRLIGVGVSGLGPPIRQLELWDAEGDRQRRLQATIDDLRERYSDRIIRRACDLPPE